MSKVKGYYIVIFLIGLLFFYAHSVIKERNGIRSSGFSKILNYDPNYEFKVDYSIADKISNTQFINILKLSEVYNASIYSEFKKDTLIIDIMPQNNNVEKVKAKIIKKEKTFVLIYMSSFNLIYEVETCIKTNPSSILE